MFILSNCNKWIPVLLLFFIFFSVYNEMYNKNYFVRYDEHHWKQLASTCCINIFAKASLSFLQFFYICVYIGRHCIALLCYSILFKVLDNIFCLALWPTNPNVVSKEVEIIPFTYKKIGCELVLNVGLVFCNVCCRIKIIGQYSIQLYSIKFNSAYTVRSIVLQ